MSGQSAAREDVILTKKAHRVCLEEVTEVDDEYVDGELEKITTDMLDVTKTFERVVGDVLTLIDASVTDKEQKKALKSLVKAAIYDGLDDLHALSELYRKEAEEEKKEEKTA